VFISNETFFETKLHLLKRAVNQLICNIKSFLYSDTKTFYTRIPRNMLTLKREVYRVTTTTNPAPTGTPTFTWYG